MPSKKYLIVLFYHIFIRMSRKYLGVNEKRSLQPSVVGTGVPDCQPSYRRDSYFCVLSIMEIKLDIEYTFAFPNDAGKVSPSTSL